MPRNRKRGEVSHLSPICEPEALKAVMGVGCLRTFTIAGCRVRARCSHRSHPSAVAEPVFAYALRPSGGRSQRLQGPLSVSMQMAKPRNTCSVRVGRRRRGTPSRTRIDQNGTIATPRLALILSFHSLLYHTRTKHCNNFGFQFTKRCTALH